MDVALAQEERGTEMEFGTVVVQITVRNGNVIAAKYTKGTTNTNPAW
jgi:alanine dehydrogenase